MQFGPAGWDLAVGQMVYYELPDHTDHNERGKRHTGQISLLAVKALTYIGGDADNPPTSLQVKWVQSIKAGTTGAAHVRRYNDDHLPAMAGESPNYIVLALDELVPLSAVL